ncbi:unnamed protein product [Prorocentrum cordatum]|uniref:Uncharacterized protein n=1 Tax=Prorocentrum cordatum TaxID=2364126 RepID=A0ABN9WIQ9_9DINO|nr:unnamed protein product [Polarella glacialis]
MPSSWSGGNALLTVEPRPDTTKCAQSARHRAHGAKGTPAAAENLHSSVCIAPGPCKNEDCAVYHLTCCMLSRLGKRDLSGYWGEFLWGSALRRRQRSGHTSGKASCDSSASGCLAVVVRGASMRTYSASWRSDGA